MADQETTGMAFRDTVAHFIASMVRKRNFADAIKCYGDNRGMIDSVGGAWTGDVLHHVAKAFASLADYPSALRLARTSQSHLSVQGDSLSLAELFMTLGGILRDMGEMKEAQRAFGDAESVFRRNDSPEGQSRALNLLAGLHYRQAEYRRALSVLLDAVAIARKLNDQKKVAFMMGNIGRIYTFIGNLREARKHLEINVQLSEKLGDKQEQTRAQIALGYVLIQQGEFDQAQNQLEVALTASIQLDLKRDMAICKTYLGELHYRRGEAGAARILLQQALEAAESFGSGSTLCGRIAHHLAEACRLDGQKQLAQKFVNKALAIYQNSDDKVEKGAILRTRALLEHALGHVRKAEQSMIQALDLHEEAGVRFEKAETLVAAGSIDLFPERQRLTYLFQAEEFYARHDLAHRLAKVQQAIAAVEYRPEGLKRQTSSSSSDLADYLTNHETLKRLKRQLVKVGQANMTLLLTGETGVGKDHMARHYHSQVRPDGPYVAINCASLPETLLESELFGYDKGAFTGAETNKQGKFATANGGVLLLDEIGDMPLGLQTKLLGVLENRKVTPLGSTREIALDFKLVAATNQDLQAMVEAGTFRRDLYYRLSGMHFEIPSLRHRKEDIPLLMHHFMTKCGLSEEGDKLPPELVRQFVAYDWPGNVREMYNKIKRLQVMQDLVVNGDLVELARSLFTTEMPSENRTLFDRVEEFERQLIVEALVTAAGNKSEAARILGVHEATVRTKLKRYGIQFDGGVPS